MTEPSLTLEVAFGKGPFDTVSGGDWTDLSDRVLSFEMDRGRQDRTANFEPGSITVLLDNSDSELDPQVSGSSVDLASTGGLPWRPVRVTVTADVDGTPTDAEFIFYTGPECWRVERGGPGIASTSELRAVDTMGMFEWVALPTSPFAAVIRYYDPDWWVRGLGGDVAAINGDSLQDSSGNGYTSLIAGSGSDAMFAASSLIPNDTDGAMLHTAGVSGYTDESTLTDATSAFTMVCVWSCDDTSGADQEIIRQRVVPGGIIRWRVECNTSGSLVFTIYDTSGTPVAFCAAPSNPADGGGRWDDGEPHLIVASFQGTSFIRIRADGQAGQQTSSIPASVTGRVIFGGGAANATIDEVAYWESSSHAVNMAAQLEAVMDGTGWGDGITLEARIGELWDASQQPGDPDNSGDPFEYHQGASDPEVLGLTETASSLAAALDEHAAWYRGAVYALRDGTVRVRTYTALSRAAYTTTYVDPVAHLTDEASPTSLPRPVRRSQPGWSGVRLDRVVNVSRVTWSGLSFELRDDDSIAAFGRRVREWESQVDDALHASWLAAEDATRFADAGVEMRAVTLSPAVDADAAAFLVSDCELEAAVMFTWTPPGESAQTIGMNIQGEKWSWGEGKVWTVELTLAPDVASDRAVTPPAFASPLAVWWAGDLTIAETTADGEVSTWTDRVGSVPVVQATSANRPLYRSAGVGSKPSVDFDGSNDVLTRAAAPFSATQGTVVAVIKSDSFTPPQVGTVWSQSSSTETTEYLSGFDHNSNGTRAPAVNRYASGGGDEVEGSSTSTTDAVIVEWSSDGDDWALRTDNVAESLTVVDGSNTGDWFGDLTNDDQFSIGATRYENSGAQVTSFMSGHIAFLAVYPAPLTTTERAELYAWLTDHYGL